MICNTSTTSEMNLDSNQMSVKMYGENERDSGNSTEVSSVQSVANPLQPEPSLTPKRTNRFFFSNPLSPIASSPENSPPSSPSTSVTGSGNTSRPKHLQLPSILSKFMANRDSSSKLSNSHLHSRYVDEKVLTCLL